MYIYKTTCLINGKIYIGQSSKRFTGTYLGSGYSLEKSVKRYGKRNFIVEVLRFCKNQKELNLWEKLYILKFNSTDRRVGYNIAKGGQGNDLSSPMKNPEVAKRCGKSKKGKNTGKDNPNYGKIWSEKQKKHLSDKMKELRKNGVYNFKNPPPMSLEIRKQKSELMKRLNFERWSMRLKS